MSFVLDETSSYKWPVKAKVPSGNGKHSVQTFNGEFKRITQTRIIEMGDQIDKNKITDMELVSEVLIGWDSVDDEEGNSVDFNKANLKKLLDVPMAATAIAQAFFESIAGAKRKN